MSAPIVLAAGHTFADIDIERNIFSSEGIEVVDARSLDLKDELWGRANGLLAGTAIKVDSQLIGRLANCEGIVRYGIGYDNVDVNAARERGMVVAIVRDYCINEVAEHALAFALSMVRGLGHWERNIRAGAWRGTQRPTMHRLSQLAFGVIGFGLIGRLAATKAASLFGTVIVYDPVVTPANEDIDKGITFASSLEEVLKAADVVSVHLPLTPTTQGLINSKNLKLMKPSSYIINVSRGGIIDELDALDAVRSGTIAGAAFDTFATEPIGGDHPFLEEPGILLSPHVAWLSEEAERELRQNAATEMIKILRGKPPSSPV